MAEKRKLTKAGYQALEDELRFLIDVRRPEYKKQLAESRAEGDLSENADYDAARTLQAEIEGRIAEIEEILKNAEIIADGSNRKITKVAIGTIVTFKNVATGESETYAIVDTVESDPFEHRISHSCPLGQALVGRSVGDKVEVKVAEPYIVEIVEIKAL